MSRIQSMELADPGTSLPLDELLSEIPWNDQGLIPAIAQDATTKDVLMLAWVNQEALLASLKTQKATYWSRSRNQLWCKGESTGHTQALQGIRLDCDGDALLYLVHQFGAACHTMKPNCFFWDVTPEGAVLLV